jgi:hypothetical protein
MAPVMLVQQIRSILANMELLAHGSTANWSPTGRSHGGSYGRPPGDEHPPHEHWAKRWEKAVYDDLEEEYREATMITRHRKRVIEKAQADLDSYRKRAEGRVVGESEESLEARVVREGTGWTIEEVAQHCRCTPTFVRRARRKAGIDEQHGKGIIVEMVTRDERAEKARAMRARGLPLRAIAMHLGCDVATIHRDLARAA